jgi:hypothetical protein
MVEMTVQQYAKIRKVTPVAVTRAMNKQKKLVGVDMYRKVRRDWILFVRPHIAKAGKKNYLVIPE